MNRLRQYLSLPSRSHIDCSPFSAGKRKRSSDISLYGDLIHLVDGFDAVGKAEIFGLFLERRSAVPLQLVENQRRSTTWMCNSTSAFDWRPQKFDWEAMKILQWFSVVVGTRVWRAIFWKMFLTSRPSHTMTKPFSWRPTRVTSFWSNLELVRPSLIRRRVERIFRSRRRRLECTCLDHYCSLWWCCADWRFH